MVRAAGWDGRGGGPTTAEVDDAGAVDALATRLLDSWASASTLPGIELGEAPGATLSIGVAADRWALVVTDETFDQHCSQADDAPDGSVDVSWGEPTPVPWTWFVDRATAVGAVDRWLTDRTLAPEVEWCDRCD